MSIARKSLIGALIIATVAIFVTAISVATASFNIADEVIHEETKNRLIALREAKKAELSNYLRRLKEQVIAQSENDDVVKAAWDLKRSFHQMWSLEQFDLEEMRRAMGSYYTNEFGGAYRSQNPDSDISPEALVGAVDDKAIAYQYHFIQQNPHPIGEKDSLYKSGVEARFNTLHDKYHTLFRKLQQSSSFDDVFLVDVNSGHVVYSVYKNLDFATSLLTGPFRESGLAKVFREAKEASQADAVSFALFDAYTPSLEQPEAFIASPIQDSKGNTFAVLVFQIPIQMLNNQLTDGRSKSLGETGETYLVDDIFRAQTVSRRLLDNRDEYLKTLSEQGLDAGVVQKILTRNSNVGLQEVRTDGTRAALSGEAGYGIYSGYNGNTVLGAYSPVDFEGSRMALMVEIEESEAFAFRSQMISSNTIATVVVSLIVLSLIAVFVWNFAQALSNHLNSAVGIAEAVARGEKADVSGLKSSDEIGSLISALDKMQNELIAELKTRELAATKLKMALDVCDTNVMVTDVDHNIGYLNHSMTRMMQQTEHDLRRDIPDLEARRLLGSSIDIFNFDPSFHRGVLQNLSVPFRKDIVIGGRTFGLIATPIFGDENNRLGAVIEWDDKTERLARIQEERRIAADNARIRAALDNCSAAVMMADADHNIIYTNDSVVRRLSAAETDIRQEVHNFSVADLIGKSVSQLHTNPVEHRAMLNRLSGTVDEKIIFGDRHMKLTFDPVNDDDGKRIGTVVEWSDKTAEIRIQQEMDNIIAAANDGHLSERINLAGKEGFFRTLSEGLNTFLDKTSSFVADMGEMFGAMSEGDLTKMIENEYRGEFDSIKNNANNTVRTLTEVMYKIQMASSAVRLSSGEVARGSNDLSLRTESQASSLEETTSSMEQLTETVRQTADSSLNANQLATEAKSRAEKGGQVVQNAVNAMDEILDSSHKINDIIGVIDDIAFQTNLLALNAAVEAARAGEQGRGFAVVAGEVRTLSQRSAAAAKEIKNLISDSLAKVESGSTLVNESGETLAKIVQSVEGLAQMIQRVNDTAIEQNNGISQINQSIVEMDAMTQQNAALAVETSASGRTMSEEATNMSRLINFFKLSQHAGVIDVEVHTSVSEPSLTQESGGPTGSASDHVNSYIDSYTSSSNPYDNGAASFSGTNEWKDF